MADNTLEQPIVIPFVPRDQGVVATPLPMFEDTRLSVSNAVNRNADYEAELLRLSQKTGVPMDSVRTHPEAVKQRDRFDAMDLDKLEAQFPSTYKFLAKQENADVAHDDTSVLGRVESAFNSFKRGIEKGSIQDELGDLNYKALSGTITPIEQARREKLKGDMGYVERQQFTVEGSAIDYFTNQTGYTARQLVSSLREGGKGALVGASTGAIAATIAGQLGPQVALPEEVLTVPGAAALGGRAGFVASSVQYNYKMEAGFAYDEFYDLRDQTGEPLPLDVVKGAATAVGLINAGLETVGEMAMLKLFPGADKLLAAGPKEFVKQMLTKPTVRAALANASKKWVQAAGVEGITEAIQELSVIFGRELAQGASGQNFAPNDIGEDAKRVGEAGMDAFVGSMGVGAPAAGYRGYRDARQAKQMEQNQEFIQALGEDATESKVQTRLPEKFKEFVARVKEGGAIDNIYIPAEQFQQFFQSKGADPTEVATQVGATNYTEALAAGTDVVIPIENYASTLAATPLHQELAQDIRLRQGEMTAREFAEYQANKEAELKGIEDNLAQLAAENGQKDYRSALQGIITDIEGQLIGAGTERSTAAAQAEAMRPFATMIYRDMLGRAERDGVEVSEQQVHDEIMRLWSQYGLNVSRPMPDILTQNLQSDISIDPLIDMLRSGKGLPTDTQVFGKSLTEFIRDAGGLLPAGELRDIDYDRKPFMRNVVQENGMSADMAAEKAVEAGYFPELDMGNITESDIFNALGDEMGGAKRYSINQQNQQLLNLRMALEQLDQYLNQIGVDLNAITDNASVRQLLEQAMSDPKVKEAVQQLFQAAYHGSPHTFEHFSLEHIGTGEGLQAYGWGLYFAEDRNIAKSYHETLAGVPRPAKIQLGSMILSERNNFDYSRRAGESDIENIRASLAEELLIDEQALRDAKPEGFRDLVLKKLDEIIDMYVESGDDHLVKAGERLRGLLEADGMLKLELSEPEGGIYTVEIPDWAVDKMLSWDLPLSEQSDYVKSILRDVGSEENLSVEYKGKASEELHWDTKKGEDFYNALVEKTGSQEAASKVLDSYGIAGVKYWDGNSRNEQEGTHNLVLWNQEAIDELNQQVKRTLFQGNESDKQGYIQFGKDRKFDIALLEKANLSTFLHETGHFWLEVVGDLATNEGASDQIKSDYATLLNWFGVESRDQITTEHHEMFARANEAYLMNGEAPSAELRGVFQRFKSWLQLIYKQLTALNVNLTPEVRGVFDRMYATDAEIEQAKHDVDMAPLFLTAADAKMTEAEFALYRAGVAEATASAKDALQAKLMREYQREQQAWWNDALKAMKAEVAAEVDERPVYKAFAALVAGEVDGIAIKLNKEALIEKYGAEYVKRLPRKFARIYTTKGGMDADAAATYLGFESGDALVEALVSMRPRNELINAEADVRMRETYGDMMTDGSLADEARIALHNEQRERVLMTELRALRRQQAEVQPFVQFERDKAAGQRKAARQAAQVPPVQMFRDAARGLIGKTAVRNIQPYRYLQAERKYARAAFEAMAKGDYALAAEAKQKELLNHYLYLEASKAKDDADATLKYVRKFESGTTREQMGKAGADYLDQIDALLDRYEFRRIPLRTLDRRKSLALWAAEQEALGNEVAVDPVLLDEARMVNYREVPIDELRAVRDAVKNIEHLARLKNKLVTKGMQAEFADAVSELVASAENNGTRKAIPLDMSAMTMSERIGDNVSRLDAMLLKMEQIVDWLDGGNVQGAWHTYLWNPIADAQVAENDLTVELTNKMIEALEAMPKEQRQSMLDTFEISGMGKVTRKFIVSIGMNMGNQQNIDKMMRGFGWNMGTIEGALSKLNAQDIAFIQQTLDTIGGLWPQIAELEKRMTGLEPEQVETAPFDVKDEQGNVIGTIRGYFPLVYDPRKSEAGAKQETGNLGQLFEEGYVRATTPKGHTKARTEGFAAPLLLDFEQVVTQHLAKVVKDLTHREAIVAANKILTNPEIRNVLQETLGTAYEKQMLPWLRSVVNDRNGGSTQGLTDFSRWMMTARANVVAATMGFKATTAIMQITGLSQSLDLVKPKYLGQALLEFLRHPVALTNQVRELSGEMRHRSNTLDRDIRDQLRNLTGQNSTWAQAQKFAFHGIALADAFVSVPTWMGAYRQALAANPDEQAARLEADRAVRLTQGAGGQKDLAAVSRNNELAKTMTMFYSYFSALYSRMRDMGHDVQSIKDMPRFLARTLFTVMIPAVMGDLIVGRGPSDDDDDKALWAIRKVLLYPLMSVPLLRDIAASLDSGFDYKFSPIAAGFEKLAKTLTALPKVVEGDMEWPDFALKAADTIGYVFGVAGTSQLTASGKYLWRVSEGEESPDNLAELIFYAINGKRKE